MINMPYKNNDSNIRKYEYIIIEAWKHLFEAENLMDDLINELVDENSERDFNFEIEFPDSVNEKNTILNIERIYRNDESGHIEIKIYGREQSVSWEKLDITTKYLIINYIHLNLLSDEIFENLC